MTNPLRFLPLALLFAFSSCTAEVPTQAPAENPTQAPAEALAENPTQAPTEAPTEAPAENLERLPEVRYYVVADT